MILWFGRIQKWSVGTGPLCHSIFVGEEVGFWPATREVDKIVGHVVYEDLVDQLVELWPLLHKSVTICPFVFQILGGIDAIAHGPDIVGMSFMDIDHDYLVSKFDFFQEGEEVVHLGGERRSG